jgi:transglycosylase-like protein
VAAGGALALPASPVAQTTDNQQAADGGAQPTQPTAKPASHDLRRAYKRWRTKLHRYGAFTGRNLLLEARAADGTRRAPTARELHHSIHRMQKRLKRYLRTPRGRAAAFRLKLHAIPAWGRGHLRSIAWCESKNDPHAIGGGGAYRGMYQFSFSTWGVVGGSGDPVAAPRAEQTWRAWLLLSRHGSGHWPVCG